MQYSKNAQLALDTLNRVPTEEIAISMTHIMEHSVIERLAGTKPGRYKNDPHGVYVKMKKTASV